jgi:hypothetical protein
MAVATLGGARSHSAHAISLNVLWERVHRPSRRKTVHRLRVAAETKDAEMLHAVLHPRVAVVVESGEADHPAVRMVNGTFDAIPLLIHAMAARQGLQVIEDTVSGQAGLVLRRGDETASVTVDFSGPLIAAVWMRLRRTRQEPRR